MIQSMTGYGKHVIQLPTKKITVEIKSLNSKSLDLNTRVPSAYRQKELNIRKLLASALTRGKIDLNLFVESTGEQTAFIEESSGLTKSSSSLIKKSL